MTAIDFFHDTCQAIPENHLQRYDNYVLCGDLNVNINVDSPATKKLLSMLTDINCDRVPILNTHLSLTNYTTLDLIFVPCDINITTYGKISVPELSAHDLIYIVYPLAVPKCVEKVIPIREYDKIDKQSLLLDACSTPWHHIEQYVNINDKVSKLTEQILNLYEKHAPVINITVSKPKSPWITPEIKSLIKERNNVRSRFSILRLPILYN